MNYLLTKEEMDAMVPRKDYEDLQNVMVEKCRVNDSLWQACDELGPESQRLFRENYRKFALARGVEIYEPRIEPK